MTVKIKLPVEFMEPDERHLYDKALWHYVQFLTESIDIHTKVAATLRAGKPVLMYADGEAGAAAADAQAAEKEHWLDGVRAILDRLGDGETTLAYVPDV